MHGSVTHCFEQLPCAHGSHVVRISGHAVCRTPAILYVFLQTAPVWLALSTMLRVVMAMIMHHEPFE
jgi:hypothetical protein